MKMKRSLLSVLLSCQLGMLVAQITPYTEKLFLNVELNSQSLSFVFEPEDEVNDNGRGAGLRVGYGFNSTFALYLGVTGANMRLEGSRSNSYRLSVAELGTRLHFGRKLKSPTFYLDIALQSILDKDDEPVASFSGGGLGLGGGLLIFVGKEFAFDVGLRGSGGIFSEYRVSNVSLNIADENIRYRVGRLSVGITWFPSGS